MNINDIIKLSNIFVFAGKIDDLQKKYPEYSDAIIYIADNDPSNNKKYLNWAVKMLISKTATINEIVDVINLFNENYNKLNNKDINSYNSFLELKELLVKLNDLPSKSKEKRKIKKSGAEKIYEDEACIVLSINDKAASCQYGFGTRWCISMIKGTEYEDYIDDGGMFYFIISKINKYINENNINDNINFEDNLNDFSFNLLEYYENIDNYDKLNKVAVLVQRNEMTFYNSEDSVINDDLSFFYKNWNKIINSIKNNTGSNK